MNKEEEENEIKIKNILSNFEISKHMIKKILISTNNVRGFNNFCNSYSKLHGKTKQVKKEFLLMMAYSSEFLFYWIKKKIINNKKKKLN